jgi:hypothetical protein
MLEKHIIYHKGILSDFSSLSDFDFNIGDQQIKFLCKLIITKRSLSSWFSYTKQFAVDRAACFSVSFSKIFSILRYQFKWVNNMPFTLFNDVKRFKDKVNECTEVDCKDLDDAGMACYLAHNFDNPNVCIFQVSMATKTAPK